MNDRNRIKLAGLLTFGGFVGAIILLFFWVNTDKWWLLLLGLVLAAASAIGTRNIRKYNVCPKCGQYLMYDNNEHKNYCPDCNAYVVGRGLKRPVDK